MIPKLKVMLVAHVGYPWGGISQRYTDLLESSLPQKTDLIFFESSPNKSAYSSTGYFSLGNILGFFDVCLNFIKAILQDKPAVVHIATAYGFSFLKHSVLVIISKIFGLKVILAPHCSISIFVPKSRIAFLWMKFILNRCDGLIVLSSEWLNIRDISPRPKVILLTNAINLTPYLQLDKDSTSPNEQVRIIYLGHIGEAKGILDLIQAVKLLADANNSRFNVLIYGEEARRGELEQSKKLVNTLHVEELIRFFEPVSGEKKLEIFKTADIYVLPSHHEGSPISIIEAMAAGLPVIATKVGGIPDLVDDAMNGILVNSQAQKELADALEMLIDSEQLRRRYGLEGRRKAVECHGVENYVDRLVKFYEEI